MPLCPPFYMFSPLLPVLQDTGACQFSREMTSFSSSGRENFVAKTILFEHSSNTLCISLVRSLRVHFEASRFSPPCRQSRPVSLPRPRVIMEGHGDYKRIAQRRIRGLPCSARTARLDRPSAGSPLLFLLHAKVSLALSHYCISKRALIHLPQTAAGERQRCVRRPFKPAAGEGWNGRSRFAESTVRRPSSRVFLVPVREPDMHLRPARGAHAARSRQTEPAAPVHGRREPALRRRIHTRVLRERVRGHRAAHPPGGFGRRCRPGARQRVAAAAGHADGGDASRLRGR